jgi:hypothetical protein
MARPLRRLWANTLLSLPGTRCTRVLTVLLVLSGGVAVAQAPDEERAVPRLRVLAVRDAQVTVDGRMDEEIWQRAGTATGFTQRDPDDGAPATQRTEVRVAYSDAAVYICVRAFDDEPELIRSRLTRRDQDPQSDYVMVALDSYHDHRTAFVFAVTPAGAIYDAYTTDDEPWGDDSWDPVWDVEATVDSAGWTAEFRIPLSQLRFDKDGSTWGLQVARRIERNAEEAFWAPNSKDGSGYASRFGEIEGFENLPSPMRLELLPYTVASHDRRPESTGSLYAPTSEADVSGGFDLKYGLTSDFTIDATVNPDFGQVEADPAVVNLTAFETYFPERRPFFVEGSALFRQSGPGGQLFYSRRIGRRPQGWADPPEGGTVEIPDASTILAAGKLTGKSASGLGLGVLSALTAEEQGILRDSTGMIVGEGVVAPLVHHFAGRIEQDLSAGAHALGGMVTALNRRLDDNLDFLRSAAYMGMVDGSHRWKRNTYVIEWQAVATHIRGSTASITSAQRSQFRYFQRPDADHVELDTTRTTLSGWSFGARGGKQTGTWRYSGGVERVSPGFDVNELGFQWGADRQEGWANLAYVQSRPTWIFRNFRGTAGVSHVRTTGWEPTGTWVRPVQFYGTFKNNWEINVNPLAVIVSRWSVTHLRGGPALRQNRWHNSWVWVASDRRKSVSADLGVTLGSVPGTQGRWWEVNPSVSLRPTESLSARIGMGYYSQRDPTQWITRRSVNDSTLYLLGSIDQQTLNVQIRLDWMVMRKLSLQLYAQPYVSAGTYDQFKEVVAPRAANFDDRYWVYDDEVACADGTCDVDRDLDGTVDFSFGQPDFNYKSFRSTFVLRWEYRPGSVVYLAWQHGRSGSINDGAFHALNDLGDLFALDGYNTFLVKVNYWIGL